jgi:hypothetical protein
VGAGGAASIDFTSIPQTYTDLKIVVSARNTTATLDCYINFNGSNTNLSRRVLYGNGSSATSASGSDGYVIWLSQSTDTANTFGNAEIYIPNYTLSNNKSFTADSVTENNATQAYQFFQAGLWSNTSAINRVTLYSGSTFAQYSTATLYGITSAGLGAKATGGIISQDNNYWYHTFTSSGTFTPTMNLTNVDYLVVAGGGGGGGNSGSGGGAGGLRCTVDKTGGGGTLESKISLNNGTPYTITVGAGGGLTRTYATYPTGVNGNNSSIAGSGLTTITSIGGGRGAVGGSQNDTVASGGSGGGGVQYNGSGGAEGGAGTANQGYAGGNAINSGAYFQNGGGGGAGGPGAQSSGAAANSGGVGGAGVITSISGTSTVYASGGSGAFAPTYSVPGGGGAAGGSTYSQSGTANTGGGGAAATGSGGSGIVIIRYAK